MGKYIFKFPKSYFIIFILLLIANSIQSKITNLKIGIKNIPFSFMNNTMIYKINTNFLKLNISITNINNIATAQITDKIINDDLSIYNCSNLNNLCQSN